MRRIPDGQEFRTSVDLRICGPHFGAMEGHAHPPVVVVNPVASRVADSSRRGRLVESVVAAVEARTGQTPIVVDASPEAAREALTEAGARAAPLAVIVGGDGTIREAASALAGAGVPIAIVPAGTGNVFAAALGIPRRAIDAIRLIGEGRPVAVDLGSASWGGIVDGRQLDPEGSMAFAVACGIGFDARVMSTASTELKRRLGFFAYVVATLREATRLRPGRVPDRGRRRGPRGQRPRRPRRELRPADPGPDRAALPDRPDRRPARRDRRAGARASRAGSSAPPSRCSPAAIRSARPGRCDSAPPGSGSIAEPARAGPDRRRRPRGRLARGRASCRARSGSCVHERRCVCYSRPRMTDQPVQGEGRRSLGVLVVAGLQFLRAVLLVGQMLGFSLFPDVDWLHIAAQLPEPASGTVAFVIVAGDRHQPGGRERPRRDRAPRRPALGLDRGHRHQRAVAGVRHRRVVGRPPRLRVDGDQRHRGVLPEPARVPRRLRRDPGRGRARSRRDRRLPISSSCGATSRSSGSPRASCSCRCRRTATSSACDLLAGPTIREAQVVAPAGSLTLDAARRGRRPAARPPPVPALRPGADERGRARPLAEPAGPAAFSAPGRLARVGLPARLVDAGLVTSLLAPRPGPGRHGRRGRTCVRRDPRARPARLVPRPRHPDRGLGRPPLPVLLRDERLALDVRRRQRPRGGLGAVLRRPRGARGRRRRSRPGSAPPPTTSRATTSAGAGTTRGSRRGRPPDRLPGRRLARDLHGARRVHHAAAVPRRAEPPRRRSTSSARIWRDTLDQPDPGDLSRQASKRALSVPFVDYARGDGVTVGPGRGDRVDADRHLATRIRGSTATAACGASTPATGSPASGRRPGRSTPGRGRSASHGSTRSRRRDR